MMICARRFNIYLLLLLSLGLVCGCKTNSSKKVMATLRAHLETTPDSAGHSTSVPIYRESPVNIVVERAPMLSENQVTEARVIEVVGGFAIQIQFDRKGVWALEQASASSRGRRLAVFTQFTSLKNPKGTEARWLGAPAFSKFIGDGVLTFTPDATREEAFQIVLGLNNAAKKLQEKW